MHETDYAYSRRFESRDLEALTEKVRSALAAEGFGVLTEIDVQATLKKKLGVEKRPYKILGACNPSLAHRALGAEAAIGVLLPCNVTVFEDEDGAAWVQAINPQAMFSLVKNPGVEPIAHEVAERLQRVMASL